MNLRRSIFSLVFFNLVVWGIIIADRRPRDLHMDFLSVGQGDSEVISLPGGTDILIDGGPGGKVLSELEESLGRKKYIDIMMLTHPHADHYVGLAEILEGYDVGAVILPRADSSDLAFSEFISLIEDRGIPLVYLEEGDVIASDDFRMDILSPSTESLKDMNARSLVTMLRSGGVKALFTGDIGSEQEKKLTTRYDIDTDVLKVAHHGSSGSSSAEFIKEATPAVSVIELGAGNRYGFPKRDVIDRLKAEGGVVYRTDTDGSLRISVGDGGLRISKLRSFGS